MGIDPAGFYGPVGALRGKRLVDLTAIAADLHVGGTVTVRSAGVLVYVDYDGNRNAETLADGDKIETAGIPVLVETIVATNTTVTSIEVGAL